MRSKLLTIETQEIPTMDPALSADAVSSRVMTNTMEGLYSWCSEGIQKSEDGKNIHLHYVKTQNGQMVSL